MYTIKIYGIYKNHIHIVESKNVAFRCYFWNAKFGRKVNVYDSNGNLIIGSERD